MKTALSFIAAVMFTFVAGRAVAQEEFPKPGPEHQQLKQFAGEWDAKVKAFNPGAPDAPAEESTGTYSAKMDVGGFFLMTAFNGKVFGGDFQGRGMSGYDIHKKKYAGVWVDSMSSAIYNTQGEFDKAGKIFTETMEGPGHDGKTVKFRSTTELKSKDSMVFKMHMPDEAGKEMLLMEITYTRKK